MTSRLDCAVIIFKVSKKENIRKPFFIIILSYNRQIYLPQNVAPLLKICVKTNIKTIEQKPYKLLIDF